MKQQFFVGDKVKRNQDFGCTYGTVRDAIYTVTEVRNDGVEIELDDETIRYSCNYDIVERQWQKNTGVQPVNNIVEVEIKMQNQERDLLWAGDLNWRLYGMGDDVVEWRIADRVSSDVEQPEAIPPSHVALGDELVSADVSTKQEWTDKHYDNNYTLTQKDIERGFVKIDPYRVSKQWRLGSKDESGVLFHILKTAARYGEKNSREREIKALHAQIKCLAEIEGVDLNG